METKEIVMDAATHAEIVQNLSEKLKANYIFPEIAEQICTRLQKYLKDEEYGGITNGRVLSQKLTKHLQEVNHDEHLWVKWHSEPLPEDEGPLRQNQEWKDERKLEAGLDNYGLHKVERLPGNVGYLDIHAFSRPAWGGDTAVAAMNRSTARRPRALRPDAATAA